MPRDVAGWRQYHKTLSTRGISLGLERMREVAGRLAGATRPAGRTVIIQFESEDQLMGWWNSPEYQELAEHRKAACTTHSVSVVHSMPAR